MKTSPPFSPAPRIFPFLFSLLPSKFIFSIEFENGWDSIELIPNIILNPGFSETDDGQSPPIAAVPLPTFTRTIVFGDESDSCESESDHEPRMEKFKRKLSVFFTDPTIKRI